MDVLLLNWKIGSVCGAQRYTDELRTGFEKRRGTTVDYVEVDGELYFDDWDGSVPDDYDLYIFTDSVPQTWKDDRYAQWWQDLFHQLADEIVFAIVHDVWWEDHRGWMLDVADDIDRLIAPQEPVERSLESFPVETVLIRHPIDTDRMDIVHDKDRLIVSASQIHPRKNVDHLIREVPNLDHEVIVHSEETWEYHQLAGDWEQRNPEYGDIWEQALENGMTFVGVTSIEELWDHYRRARFVTDLQGADDWKHVINYTQIEPMLFGAVPIVYRDVVNPLMAGHVLLLDHYSDLPELIASVTEAELRQYRRVNADFVVDTFEAEHVAGQFEALVTELATGQPRTA